MKLTISLFNKLLQDLDIKTFKVKAVRQDTER